MLKYIKNIINKKSKDFKFFYVKQDNLAYMEKIKIENIQRFWNSAKRSNLKVIEISEKQYNNGIINKII